eukprot:8994198-Pyramimonas_sp.AAC.1
MTQTLLDSWNAKFDQLTEAIATGTYRCDTESDTDASTSVGSSRLQARGRGRGKGRPRGRGRKPLAPVKEERPADAEDGTSTVPAGDGELHAAGVSEQTLEEPQRAAVG